MLADAAERAQEAIDAAEEEAAEIIKAAEHRASEIEAEATEIVKAAEHRAGDIEGEARRTLEGAQAEGARVEEDALQAAEEMRAQAEQDARAVLEEARDATDMIWQEAERERLGVEAETIRLETLRHRSLEQLGRVYGHLESVLDEVRAGIGRVEEEQEDLDEATAAAAARLGVEPPASSPEESPRFPDLRDTASHDDEEAEGDEDDEGMLSPTRPDTPAASIQDATVTSAPAATGLASTPGGPDASAAVTTQPQQPALPDTDDASDLSANGGPDTTQPIGANGSADATTETVPAATAEPGQLADGGVQAPDQDVTQRMEPVGKPSSPKAPTREGKPGS
jgi:hypothetical protein